MGAMSPWHWAIVALVLVVLFGSKKLPDAARGLGRSLRILKSEVAEMDSENASAFLRHDETGELSAPTVGTTSMSPSAPPPVSPGLTSP